MAINLPAQTTTDLGHSPKVAPHIFLIGRPPLAEFLGYVTTQASSDEAVDQGALAEEWRAANDHVRVLSSTEAGIADNVPVLPIPEMLEQRAARVVESELYRSGFQLTRWSIGLVELDRLVVRQKDINLAHVDRVKFALGDRPDDELVFDTCLPLDPELPAWNVARVAQNGFAFVSPSNDFRMLDVDLLRNPAVIVGDKHGRVVAGVTVLVGFTVNAVSIVRANGRLLLHNGSHRAYALRELGVTHAPAIVMEVSRPEELEVVAGVEVAQDPGRYLEDPRPPILRDYFDAELRRIVSVPERVHQVRIAWGVEVADNPI